MSTITRNISSLLILVFFVNTHIGHAQKTSTDTESYDRNKKHTVEELYFDLIILKDALVKAHPGLFWYQTEQEFEACYTKVKNAILTPMTEMEFYNLLAPLVGSVRCGHTHMFFSEGFNKCLGTDIKLLPLSVRIIESKIYIKENLMADTTVRIYSEIASINGVSADSLLRFMEPHGFGWVDGFTKSPTRIEEYFQILLLSLFDYPDSYTLNTIEPNGNKRLIECTAQDEKTCARYYKKRYALGPKYNPFRFRTIDSLSAGIITIDEFVGKGFEKFLANTFEIITKNEIKNLIIDLRGNVGGDGSYPDLLYSYIALADYRSTSHMEATIDNPNDSIFKYGKLEGNVWDYGPVETSPGTYDLTKLPETVLPKNASHPHANNFTGKVFVLTNVKSYSASTSFCSIARYNKRATFIGRETGGGYCGNTSSFDFVLTLPNTGIRIPIPLIKSYAAVDGPCGEGIKPDYVLKEDINDYITNRDSDLLFTLDLIYRSK